MGLLISDMDTVLQRAKGGETIRGPCTGTGLEKSWTELCKLSLGANGTANTLTGTALHPQVPIVRPKRVQGAQDQGQELPPTPCWGHPEEQHLSEGSRERVSAHSRAFCSEGPVLPVTSKLLFYSF